MFRRSRFSIRPNVGTAGKTAAAPQEAPSAHQEASESSAATAVTDNKSVGTPSEKSAAPGDGNDQNGEGTSSSAAVQRRKRFSIKPKVAPGRPAALARTPKSPVKAVSGTAVEVPGLDLDKPTTSSQTGTTAAPQALQSPRRRRPSEESKQLKVQPKPTLTSSDNSGPLVVPTAEDSLEQTHLPADSGKQLESTSESQVKQVSSRLPDKVPPSLPDKEATEISEKAKTLMSSKSGHSLSSPAFSLSRLLNDPSDLQRLAKARKLRELLRQEIHKEKKIKKAKARVKEYTLDPAKMTMRELIRYLPVSNPMTSSLEDVDQENETVVPPSPGREESPERVQEPEVSLKILSPGGEEEEEEQADEEQDDALMVPQVKVAEDGSLIIDEESLTVEVQRAKGPNPATGRDPIFERGSTTTYSSFRKGTYCKPWSSEETDMFFLAVSMVGTDFSMICQLFPHRARSEIKNKFKKEERANSWRIDKAFRERRKLDIEYFSKLLEKILEVQKNRKKLKSLAEKNSPKKHKRQAKGKKATSKLSDVEEEEENEVPDLEGEEGEKENDELCNEGGSPVSKPKKKRKRKNQQASTEEQSDKTNKTDEKSNEQDEAYIPEDAEAALPDVSEKTETRNAAKDTAIKPAKLSRGRTPKPVLPLGRKWGKKPLPPSTKAEDAASDKGDEGASDGAFKEQVNKDASPLRQTNKRKLANDDVLSEEEDVAVQPLTATRYGRVPKPIKPLAYPAKEDAHSSASETTPASPAGSTASAARPKPKYKGKRGRPSKPQSTQESKKPKLFTLRASQSTYNHEEDENQWEEEEEEVEEEQHLACSSKDSAAPVFVPASLRSPHPMISEVEETFEEFDILASMPDVLGISQDAVCPEASCELAQNDTTEPCEHQLDLLVDVIDFLSSEHTDASQDESYNEAAQTLLTIGNLAHLSQSAQNQISIQDHIAGTTSVSVNEIIQHIEEEGNSATPPMSAVSVHGVTETSKAVATVELQNSTTDNGDIPIIKTSVLLTGSDTPQLQSSPESSKKNSPQTRKSGRVSKVKPKPSLGQASRAAQSISQRGTSTVRTSEDTVDPELSQASETLSAVEETHKIADSQKLLKAEMSCTGVKLTEEASGSQERSVGRVKLGAATSDESVSENLSHCFSDAQFEPSLEQATRDSSSTSESTDEKLISHLGSNTSSCNNPLTSDSSITESVGRGSNIMSAPVQESSGRPASRVTHVDLSVCRNEESDDAPVHQTRKSRFQKVKPNLARTSRTVHSKPQTKKDTLDKDSHPTPNSKFHDNRVKEVEADPTCTTSPEKPSQSPGPASGLIPSLNLVSTLTPTVESSTDVGGVGQVESGAATSDQSPSEAKFESSMGQNTRGTRPASESTDEKLISHLGSTTSSCNNPLTSDSSVTESQVGQGSNIESAPVQESSDHPASRITPVEDLSVSQKEEREDASPHQTRKSRFQKVKPNLARTSRTVRSKSRTTKDPVTHIQLLEKPSSPTARLESTDGTIPEVEAQPTCSTSSPEKPSQIKSPGTASVSAPSLELCSTHKPAEELFSTEDQNTDVGSAPESISECSERNVPQRRQRFPKVKPRFSLGASARTTQTKLKLNDTSKPEEHCHMDTSSNIISEQQFMDNNNAQTELNLTEKDSEHLTTHCSLHTERLSSTKLGHAESEKSPDSTNDKGTSSDGIITATYLVAGNQSMLTDSVLDNKRSENLTVEEESTGNKTSNNGKMEAGPASQLDCRQDLTNSQPTDDPTAFSDFLSSEDGSTVSKIKSIHLTQTTSDPKESTQQPRSENDSEARSRDAVQQCSETTETNQTAAQIGANQSEPADSSKSSRKAPQTRRGRLIKPKPNLRTSSLPPQLRQVQNTEQAEADSGTGSEGVDTSISHKPVSELQPYIQEPVEGAVDQRSNQNSSPNVAGSSLSCVTQALDNPTPDALTSSTEGTQSQPSLTVFPNMLLEQVPSDTDEPFFVLSLMEIPLCSSEEVGDRASEPLPYLPVTDASIQQQSSVLVAAGDGPLSNTADGSGETGLISRDIGPDPAAYVGSIMENPVYPHDSTTVQPSKLPETAENNDETEIPPTKQRLMGTRRGAKLQVKPNATRKKQASKTLSAKEAESVPIRTNTTQGSGLPGPSVQSNALGEVVAEPQKGSGDHVDIEKKTLGGGKYPEDSSSGTQTARTRGNRKPKGIPSFLSETSNTAPSRVSSRGKATSKAPKVKTPRATGKRSTPAPVASTLHDVAPTPSPALPPEKTYSTRSRTSEHSRLRSDPAPSTSWITAEVSQQSDNMGSSSIEEEPTSVSQYFLSDIFTDVNEG